MTVQVVQLPGLQTAPTGVFPDVPLRTLDTLWFQVAGTICNLRCSHCFISCSPENHSHPMMSFEQVKGYLEEAFELGVREYYFTGGEPFMNRDIFDILKAALAQGPTSVLTNGVLIDAKKAAKAKVLSQESEYSFDLRISLDGYDAETNDPIRGEGTFVRILAGIGELAKVGLNPVVTVTEAFDDAKTRAGRAKFLSFLKAAGLSQPRLKIMPLLRMGAEEDRGRGYHAWETLAGTVLSDEDLANLQCSTCRMVGAKGVYVCPILIDEKSANLGQTLSETLEPFSLSHSACYTCHVEGLSCAT